MVEYGPVKVIEMDFTEGEFDFKKAAEERGKYVQEALTQCYKNLLDHGTIEPILTEEEQIRTNLKYAVIYEGGVRRIVYVDKETMKAYRMINNDYYMGGLAKPLDEIQDAIFDHWCSGMEL